MRFTQVMTREGKPIFGDLKVRYMRGGDGEWKNTLLTLRSEGMIYFGISRLNPNDRFCRELGRSIAACRLSVAMQTWSKGVEKFTESKSHFYGCLPEEDIQFLYSHFQGIDNIIANDRQGRYRALEAERLKRKELEKKIRAELEKAA